jgi:hypothetical protein
MSHQGRIFLRLKGENLYFLYVVDVSKSHSGSAYYILLLYLDPPTVRRRHQNLLHLILFSDPLEGNHVHQ